MKKVHERFLDYISYDTQSDANSKTCPSTPGQIVLANHLKDELIELGLDAHVDSNGYVYSHLEATPGYEDKPAFALIAHMDTAPDMSGHDIKPRIIYYEGGDIVLNKEKNIVTEADKFPELQGNLNEHLIVTDGTTLLGADDKAGVAGIMTFVEYALSEPSSIHPYIDIVFTPDEEIGRGVDLIDMSQIKSKIGYTMDGGEIGIFQYETFNAASAIVTINGISAHPGYAKNRMVNSLLIGQEFHSMLPMYETPRCTEKREGFYHLNSVNGNVEKTVMNYSLRDHDDNILNTRKDLILSVKDYINKKYGDDCCKVEIIDMYKNMGVKVLENPCLIENGIEAIKSTGTEPIIEEVRGGTDGSRLSFMGLPCPNMCTGGHNGHSRYEYVSIESLEKQVKLITKLAEIFAR